MDFAQPPPLHQALEVTGHQLDKNKSAETFSPTFVNRDSFGSPYCYVILCLLYKFNPSTLTA